ncbi:glycine betaine ABC transporter substrate-binding protein [Mycetocola zhadangensis]|uniref:glycine betaine ABC transporter substrate-binding protein n=1 Tax=Mycetocola zhadangensis TaxID=1164595 RepID=UPI003A4E4078
MNFPTRIATATILGAALVALTGCSAGSTTETLENGDEKEITIAVFNGWDEAVASSVLWRSVLEEQGYDVTLEYADPAPVFTGLAASDYDLNLDVWLPFTHKSYLEQYGEDIVDLGAWNSEGKNAIAVNADAPINSIAELADNADLFGNRIVGIEPGAGLTMATEERVIPTYGLEDMDYVTSSTSAMLTELTSATRSGENIAVTLWEPHWAYSEFPLKNLEDPEGALGEMESIHTYASSEFPTSHPVASGWFENFTMDLDVFYSLENALFVEYDGDDYAPIVEKWIDDNREYVDGLIS